MIIGVDAGCLGVSDKRLKTGVYRFSLGLLKRLTFFDRKNKYRLYSFTPLSKEVLSQFGNNTNNIVLRPKKGWMSLRVSLEFLLNSPDIFLGLSQALPLYHPHKSIIFVHDLAFEYYPDGYKKSYRRLSRQTKSAARNADKIISVSQSTKNDLIDLYGIEARKIAVIYHGVEPIFFPQPQKVIEKTIKKYLLDTPFFLFVGSLKSIKNIPRLISAYEQFLRKIKTPYKLILAGSNFWFDEKITQTIEKLKLKDKVKIIGYINDEDLPGIYSGATAFVSPSLYEGFGLPHLEALSCGIPVVGSNLSSLPEIIGDAGLLVDPKDTGMISDALFQLATNIRLQKKLKEKALSQAKKFSWEKSAKKLLELYE